MEFHFRFLLLVECEFSTAFFSFALFGPGAVKPVPSIDK